MKSIAIFGFRGVPYLCGLILVICFSQSCTADQLPDTTSDLPCLEDPVVYIDEIQPLMDTYCNIPDCHDSGSALGDYTSYAMMQGAGVLEDSKFKNRVIDTPIGDNSKMPPPFSNGPTEINQADLELIQCWIAQGYPEN